MNKANSANSPRWDLVALGEVMLRLDPGDMRIANTRSFRVWEGGGEYNVARGLHRCFGMRTAIVTAFAENPVGRLLEDLIRQGGVDQSFVRWVPYDGVGRTARNGLNFVERGFGLRAALGCSDRGHSAASQMRPGEVDWDTIFGEGGARWFHTGGIFAALSETAAATAEEAMRAAKRHGVTVSYDLNFRPSLWKAHGGARPAVEVNRKLAGYVDVLFGNEEDYHASLGISAGSDGNLLELDLGAYGAMLARAEMEFPNLRGAAVTLRRAHTASRNDWGALCRYGGRLHQAAWRRDMEIYDRVGGGDSFASGFIYGLLTGREVDWALQCGVAHGALAMTTPGDTSMATLAEVERCMKGVAVRVER